MGFIHIDNILTLKNDYKYQKLKLEKFCFKI